MLLQEYKTFEEKDEKFFSEQIVNKEQLEEFFMHIKAMKDDPNKVFRGQNEAKYKLYSSAQRVWIGEELNGLSYAHDYKKFIMYQIEKVKTFQGNILEKFYNSFGKVTHDFSYLSFLQHYGAPTPLLDWTQNCDCALFFATDNVRHNPSEDIDNYFSIYHIDFSNSEIPAFPKLVKNAVADAYTISLINPEYKLSIREFLSNIKLLEYSRFEGLSPFYLPSYSEDGIIIEIPQGDEVLKLVYNEHNLNIISQEGLFIFNNDEQKPLEDFFLGVDTMEGVSSDYRNSKIFCWNIHKNLKEYIVKYLNSVEPFPINRKYLFPQEEVIALSAFKDFKNFS
jgi:hypothetical protein